MKKLNNEQMENLQGGLLPEPIRRGDLCVIGMLMTMVGLANGDIGMDAGGLNLQWANC